MATPFPLTAVGRDSAALLAGASAACFDAPWDAAVMDSVLAMPGTSALVAPAPDGTIAGFAVFRLMVDEGEILTLGVVPAHRGTGLGRRLVDAVLATALAGGAGRLVLEVGADNPAAIALYSGAGFAEVGRRPAYYPRPDGSRAEALILAVTLPA